MINVLISTMIVPTNLVYHSELVAKNDGVYQQMAQEELVDIGWKSFESKNYPKCLNVGNQLVRLTMSKIEGHRLLGRCYERLGMFSNSYDQWLKLTEIAPTDAEGFRNRAVLALKLLEIETCRKDLRIWRKRFPKDSRINEVETLLEGAVQFLQTNSMGPVEARQWIKNQYLNRP